MHRQTGFVLALLFLANFLTVQADEDKRHVVYIGHTGPFVGDGWYITCEKLLATDEVKWTRNGMGLQQEIDNKELEVSYGNASSTLSSASAKPSQQGIYKCTSDSAFGHVLEVHSESPTSEKSSNASATTTEERKTERARYVLEPKKNLTLVCAVTSDAPVYWQLNSQNVTNDEQHFELQQNSKQLFIQNPGKAVFGNYTCKHNLSAPGYLSLYRVIDLPQVILPRNSSAVEEDKLNLQCKILPEGLGPEITWFFGNNSYSTSKGRVKLSKDPETGIENVFLTVENISMSDAGFIYCRATFKNVVGRIEVEGFTQFTVKDKLAALWPFLGICVEVIILCAIILIYEKKRNKAELEESDTDQSPDTKPTPNKDSDVRQRK